jgi:hypothetical protein
VYRHVTDSLPGGLRRRSEWGEEVSLVCWFGTFAGAVSSLEFGMREKRIFSYLFATG